MYRKIGVFVSILLLFFEIGFSNITAGKYASLLLNFALSDDTEE